MEAFNLLFQEVVILQEKIILGFMSMVNHDFLFTNIRAGANIESWSDGLRSHIFAVGAHPKVTCQISAL